MVWCSACAMRYVLFCSVPYTGYDLPDGLINFSRCELIVLDGMGYYTRYLLIASSDTPDS